MLPNHFCFQITIITIVTIILYIQKEHEHVAVDASIKFVAVNNAKSPCKIRLYDGFYNSTF